MAGLLKWLDDARKLHAIHWTYLTASIVAADTIVMLSLILK
jgi:hypothetical protein